MARQQNRRIILANAALLTAVSCGGNGSDGAGGASGTGATSSTSQSSSAGTGGSGGGSACAPADVYVAEGGQGDACSCGAPCALEVGRDHARTLAPKADADVVVLLRGGTYRLGKAFTLTAADSGQNGHAIVYRAAPGETPLLTGAIQVKGLAPAPDLPGAWVASVPPGTHARELWVNGRRATRARGPDAPAGFTRTANGFTLGDPEMASWPDRGGIELVGSSAWEMFRCPVSDVSAGGITVAAPCWSYAQSFPLYSFASIDWIENARELLDEGGEFYLDDAKGALYYHPRDGEDVAKADVELPVLEEIVHGAGTPAAPLHDVTFDGLAFSYATWTRPSKPDGYATYQAGVTRVGGLQTMEKNQANVTFHAVQNVRVKACHFAHLGGAALAFEVGAKNNLVDSCRFDDVSGSAVMIGDVTHDDDHHPKDPALIVADNTVQNSYITRAGAEYFDTPGIFVGYTTHTSILSNELFDLPYSGISVGWGWGNTDVGGQGGYTTPTTSHDNEIRKNLISYHMRRFKDGGAIYTLGAQSGSTMAGNVVKNQANPYGNLYLDAGTQHYTLQDNVIFIDPKQDAPQSDPDRTFWLYVQVNKAPSLATNNKVLVNYTNDPTLFTPNPIDPSNTVTTPTLLSGGPSAADGILAAAGTSLRSPNVAAGKPVTASSVFNASYGAALGNDDNAHDGWSPAASDKAPYWQVDLGVPTAIDAVEVVSRLLLDQPETRRAYQIVASSDPSFASPIVLGAVDRTGLPHRGILAIDVSPPVTARYVRVAKTDPEYFFLAEVLVHGRPAK